MSRWEERVQSHNLFKTIEQVEEWITSGLEKNISEETPEREVEARRLRKVLELIKWKIRNADPETIPPNLLNGMDGHIRHQGFWNQVNSFGQNGDAAHLRNANDHIDTNLSALASLSNFSKVEKGIEATIESAAFDDFARRASDLLVSFQTRVSESETEVQSAKATAEETTSSLRDLRNLFDAKLNEWETVFSEKSNERSEKFSDAEIERKKTFEQWLSSLKQKSNSELDAFFTLAKKEYGERWAETEDHFDTLERDATTRHNSIVEIHGLVANDGVAGGYKSLSDKESKRADKFRLVSIGFIIATAIWLIISYITGTNSTSDGFALTSQVVKAISLTGVLLGGAAYCGRQSNLHRSAEQRTRWFALEVQALDPFLQSLPEEVQQELKTKFSERVFGKDFKPHPETQRVQSSNLDVTAVFRELLNKIPNK